MTEYPTSAQDPAASQHPATAHTHGAQPPATPQAAPSATTNGEPRSREGLAMVGCGGAIAISAVLPWATAVGVDVSPMSASTGLGMIIMGLGVGLAAYGWQGTQRAAVRFNGLACAAIVIVALIAVMNYAGLDALVNAAGGTGAVSMGIGMYLVQAGWMVGTWALVGLWRNARRVPQAPPSAF